MSAYQLLDLGMMINHSLFRQNRQLGYILKPEYMRCSNPDLPPPEPTKYHLQVRVISGQNLPKPADEVSGEVIDPLVEIEMVSVEHGLQFSSGQATSPGSQTIINMREELFSTSAPVGELAQVVVRRSLKSDVVINNGFNPTWSLNAIFAFSTPELSFLR